MYSERYSILLLSYNKVAVRSCFHSCVYVCLSTDTLLNSDLTVKILPPEHVQIRSLHGRMVAMRMVGIRLLVDPLHAPGSSVNSAKWG